MTDEERAKQQMLHEAIEIAIDDDLGVLTGWVVVFETQAFGDEDRASCGHFYGPNEMTTWRALGLVEWAKHKSLLSDDDVEDE